MAERGRPKKVKEEVKKPVGEEVDLKLKKVKGEEVSPVATIEGND